MIEIKKDKKSPTWIITKTDTEGFHHQISVTKPELDELFDQIYDVLREEEMNNILRYIVGSKK